MIHNKNKSKFMQASGAYFIGNVFDKAMAFITIPIFARLLNTSDYGVTATYVSWMNIITVFITLSLGNSIRTAVQDFSKEKDQYISSIFFLGMISSVLITLTICLSVIVFNVKVPIYIVLMCCADAFGTSILSGIKTKYMMEVKFTRRVLLQCMPNLVIVIISIFAIISMDSNKYLGRIFSYFVVSFSLGIGYIFFYFVKGHTFYNRKYWQYALKFSLPLIFHGLSAVILSQSDRTMITALYGSSETGLYSLAYQFGMVPLVFTTTFENIWIPWFTKRLEEDDRKRINRMVIPYIYFVSMVCVGIMLIAPEVLMFVTTVEYYGAINMIAPICLATFFMFIASILLDLEYYLKKTKMIAINTVIAAVINITLNLIFIPKYGGTAAAYTTVVAYAVSFFMHYLYARRLEPGLFRFRIYMLPMIILVVCTIMITVFMNFVIIRWCAAAGIGLLCCTLLYKYVKDR